MSESRHPWRAAAWSTGVIAAMAALAWGTRWNPQLTYVLLETSFYLETPVERADGSFEPPVINCAVTGTVTNAGSGMVWADQSLAAEWDPPAPEETYLDANLHELPVRQSVHRLGFRHVPPDTTKVRYRFRTFVMRPNRWKDWLAEHLPYPGTPSWLESFSSARESRVIESPWYEAEVPSAANLRPNEAR